MSVSPELAERKQALRSEPHFVYHCFDADGDRIYVGCTHNVEQRMQQHSATVIGTKTTRIDVSEYPNQRTALDAEREAIRRFEPLFNRQTWFMDVESWTQLRILQRLWLDVALNERIPSMEQHSNPVTHLRSVFMDRYDEDPIHLIAETKKEVLEDEIGGVKIPIVRLRLKRMKAYPELSPSKLV